MSTKQLPSFFKLSKLSAVLISSTAVLIACGGGGGGGGSDLTNLPLSMTASPFIGVPVLVTCANGVTGTGVVGTTTSPGSANISVASNCAAPIRISVTGTGKMRPLGAPADGTEDVVYDPSTNVPISNILTTVPTAASPGVANPLTSLVASQFSTASLSTVTPAAVLLSQTSVATSLGLPNVAAMNQDYRNPDVAAAAARISAVVSLATSNNNLSSGSGKKAAEFLTSLANAANGTGANAVVLSNASAMGSNVAGLGLGTKASELTAINDDANRVNSIVSYALNNAPTTASLSELSTGISSLLASSVNTQALNDIRADATSRIAQAANQAVQAAAAKVVVDIIASAPEANKEAYKAVAQAAANQIVSNQTAASGSTVRIADLAAQAKVMADSVVATLKADMASTTKVLGNSTTVGSDSLAAALVGQAQSVAKNVTSISTDAPSAANLATAAQAGLKVVDSIKNLTAPANDLDKAAMVAAVTAVAKNSSTASDSSAITGTVSSIKTNLATLITSGDAGATALATQAATQAIGTTAIGSTSVVVAAVTALPTTSTAATTSSTAKATTTTTTTTTAAPTTTTTTAAPTTTTTTAAPTTTTTTAAPTTTTTTAAPTTTTTTAAPTTTTTTAAPTTTTTTATTTSTTAAPAFSGTCAVTFGSVTAYVTNVTSASQCSASGIAFDGTNATVAAFTGNTLLSGRTSVAFSQLQSCDPFGAPPAAGASTATPCKK